jgi:hypothetical protein
MSEVHLEILRMIQEGVISAEEGELLLDAVDGATESADGEGGEERAFAQAVAPKEPPEERLSGMPNWARRTWVYVLAGGFVLLALAGMVTAQLVQGGERLGWLALTTPLMILGALTVALAWWSRTARWLHVRVQDRGTQFTISLPLPLHLVAGLVRLVRPWLPDQWGDTAMDEMILSLAKTNGQDDVLAVEVTESEGEEVLVYIG